MNGRIVKIGQHHYRMREVRIGWSGGPFYTFELVYWVEEAPA